VVTLRYRRPAQDAAALREALALATSQEALTGSKLRDAPETVLRWVELRQPDERTHLLAKPQRVAVKPGAEYAERLVLPVKLLGERGAWVSVYVKDVTGTVNVQHERVHPSEHSRPSVSILRRPPQQRQQAGINR